MDYAKLQNYRHADPLKVRQVWDAVGTIKGQRPNVPADKLVKSLRKQLDLKDDHIRLLLDEIEGDGLIEKVDPPFGKNGPVGYRLPDFTKPCPRGKHDWYCFQCHKPGEVLKCSDCFRVYHSDCVQEATELSSPSGKSLRSPTLHDGHSDNFTCPVCESRPKCEFSRKQIRKLLEFATHQLHKQSLWKTFLQIGYSNEITKNEYLVYKYTDLEVLQRKIKDGRYAALEEFSMDVQLLVHDVCILHGSYSDQADEVRFFLRSVNTELKEIQLCTDCYINAKTRLTDWISKPCKPPHELIWARNRTFTGAGLYSDAAISRYYWPAKILLERDDAYEIRFFGGTHERALAKKTDTRPFHLPADEVGVFRRSNTSGALPGGGFERAWNEVTKLQTNIDSGYYSHSSGESDLPPSDDDYSDEVYLGPRRGVSNHHQRAHRTDSPHSSSTSNKHLKRRRHASSSSHQTTTSATPTNDALSPISSTSPAHSAHLTTNSRSIKTHVRPITNHSGPNSHERKKYTSRISMPPVQPGTPGAAAMSALAETKAAMAAAVGHRKSSELFTADLFSLTGKQGTLGRRRKRHVSSIAPGRLKGVVRGKRGRGRPPKNQSRIQPSSRHKSLSSSSSTTRSSKSPSSLSSDSLSDIDNDAGDHHHTSPSDDSESNWHPKKNYSTVWKTARQTRGRPRTRGHAKVASADKSHRNSSTVFSSDDGEDNANPWGDISGRLSKSKAKPGRGRPKQSKLVNNISPGKADLSGKKRLATPEKTSLIDSPGGFKKAKRTGVLDGLNDRHDEDDELTDRCCSPSGIESRDHTIRNQKGNRRRTPQGTSPGVNSENRSFPYHSPNRKESGSGSNSLAFKSSPTKRTSSTTPKNRSSRSSNFSSCSSPSTSDADSDSGVAHRRRAFGGKITEEDRKFRSPARNSANAKDSKSPGASSTMLRRPPFAPPLSGSNASMNSAGHLGSDRASFTAAANLFYSNASQNFPTGPDGSVTANATTAAVLAAAASLAGSNHPLAGALGQAASGLLAASSGGAATNNISGVSTLPRSHLPPNKRAAAAATAAALSSNSSSTDANHHPGQQTSPRGMDTGLQSSPRKLSHKGVQTPPSMEMSHPCAACKERESARLAEADEHKRAMQELEERLAAQFQEDKAAALQATMEQAQTSMREAIEREQKLAHEALEAAEARFSDLIVQTKRRQWCRNCLSEAIYHCCWNTSYCSIQCQQEHWQKEHKRQCRRKR
ncbi:unnamed protein product [Calicophoron daubneyi]|uniref:Zinc finger MYND domain-containing protein 11 n=1 Tax=Calicophoron daubneyi TaxID=300641 RepID=A0AAV2TG75_CALDB